MRRGMSGRELRRLQARQDRKTIQEMGVSSTERIKAQMFRNGITADDLVREYKKGAEDGRRFAEEYAFHTIYAAFLITMIDNHGMDQDEAVDLLKEIDQQTVICAEDMELVEEAYKKTGIKIEWAEAIDRIQEVAQ